jgi:hypothetical protein
LFFGPRVVGIADLRVAWMVEGQDLDADGGGELQSVTTIVHLHVMRRECPSATAANADLTLRAFTGLLASLTPMGAGLGDEEITLAAPIVAVSSAAHAGNDRLSNSDPAEVRRCVRNRFDADGWSDWVARQHLVSSNPWRTGSTRSVGFAWCRELLNQCSRMDRWVRADCRCMKQR